MKNNVKVLLCPISKNNFYDNTKAMFLYLLENTDYNIKYVVNDDTTRNFLNQKYPNKFISLKTKEGKKFLKEADFWLLDGGMPTKNIFYMRNKKIINFWHGVPLKKIAYPGRKGLDKLRMFIQLSIFRKFITAYATTSNNLIDLMASSFLLPISKIKVLGQPRNENINKLVDRSFLLKIYPRIDVNNKFILYAPTWRQGAHGVSLENKTSFFPFPNFDLLDFNKFLVENNITVFLRPHPLEKLDITETSNIKILDINKLENINDVLNVFDLLIADYSSIYIDFLLTQKPIMFLPYDLEEYSKVHGLNFDYENVTPGPKPKNYLEFKNEIIKLIRDPLYYSKERYNINDYFNQVKENPCLNALKLIESLI